MFCNKCGVEFRDERKVCGCCGAARPPIDEWELDWEDAARMREAHEMQTTQAVVTPASRFDDTDSCVRPGDPRQICADCGKELPASAISNVCALCTIHRSNREATLARQRSAARPIPRGDRSYVPSAEQYDADSDGGSAWHNAQIHSERDSATRERNIASHEREAASHSRDREAAAYVRDTAGYQQEAATYERALAAESAHKSDKKPTEKKATHSLKILVGFIVIFFIVTNMFSLLGSLFFNFVRTPEVSNISSVSLSVEEDALYTQFLQPCIEQVFATAAPELLQNGDSIRIHSDFSNFVAINPDSISIEIANINNFVRGYATFSWNETLYEIPFRVCFVFVEDGGAYSTYFELMDTVQWDYMDQPISELTNETPITLYELSARYAAGEYDTESSFAPDQMPQPVSSTVGGVNVSVDPMVEMLSVIQYLSDYDAQYGLLTDHKTSYHDDLETFFRQYEDHVAVQFFNEVMQQGFAFDIPPTACLYLDDTFAIRPEFDDSDFKRNRLNADIASFRDVMKSFYIDTNFAEFYQAHQGFYRNMIDTYTANFPTWNMTETMESYYGKHAAGYHIILVPLFHQGGFGPSLEFDDGLHIYSVQGPYQAAEDTPLFGDSDAIANLVLHEFGHSFVPVNERDNPVMVAEAQRSEYLMDAVREDMERNAYSDWTSAYEELVLRAAVIDIMRQNTTVDPESLLQYEREVGFLYIDTAYEAVQIYSQNRAQYPVFDDFVPLITDALLAAYPPT